MEEMEQKEKPSIWKTSLNYGLITGIALILLTVIFYLINDPASSWINYLTYPILIVGIILAIKYHRDQQNAGFISYGQALWAGTLTGLFASIITSVFTILLFHVIDPAAMERMLIEAELRMIERMPDMTDQQIEDATRISRTMMQPAIMFFSGVAVTTFISFLFSLIISAFMKKQPSVEV